MIRSLLINYYWIAMRNPVDALNIYDGMNCSWTPRYNQANFTLQPEDNKSGIILHYKRKEKTHLVNIFELSWLLLLFSKIFAFSKVVFTIFIGLKKIPISNNSYLTDVIILLFKKRVLFEKLISLWL